jgi:quercetin dioxygenase-like cupin family protein
MSSITKIKSRPASVRRFTEFKTYTDPGAVNQICRDLLDRGAGEAANLQIGICQIKGPGQVAEDAHATWSQYFVCTEGRGTLFIEGVAHLLEAGMIVEIPKNTRHYAQCTTGESLTYFFINIHD